MARGLLIVFEGAEGAGKTTQTRRLSAKLASLGFSCTVLREPGGTVPGERIRNLLLDPSHELTAATEALLFMAARAELVALEIRPALERGEMVLLDRFFLSTYAYQVGGRGLDETEVRGANQLAVQGLVPDLTFVFDLSSEEGMARADARGERDRMERAGDDFHHRVAAAFQHFLTPGWQGAHPECGPIVRLDASGTEEVVCDRLMTQLAAARPETFGALTESKIV